MTISSDRAPSPDSLLAESDLQTRREVLRRRSRKLKQLAQHYKKQYRILMEVVRSQHKEFCFKYGESPIKSNNTSEEEAEGAVIPKCAARRCKKKPMELTKYCHMHILMDKEQQLYVGCAYVKKTPSSSSSGPLHCGKPALRSATPICSFHLRASVSKQNSTPKKNKKADAEKSTVAASKLRSERTA